MQFNAYLRLFCVLTIKFHRLGSSKFRLDALSLQSKIL